MNATWCPGMHGQLVRGLGSMCAQVRVGDAGQGFSGRYSLYLTLPAFHPSTIRGHQVVNEEVYELINVDEDDLDLDTQWLTSECYLSSSPRAVKKVRRCFIFLNN